MLASMALDAVSWLAHRAGPLALAGLLALSACGSDALPPGDASSAAAGGGEGGAGSSGGGTAGGGEGGGVEGSLEALLDELRADPPGAMQRHAHLKGWPLPVEGGRLFVSTDPSLAQVAGDHDGWTGTNMLVEAGFAWVVLPVSPGDRYKFRGGTRFEADPHARAYAYDEFGELSLVDPEGPHLERWPRVGDGAMPPRTLRVWVPEAPPTRVLYVHDGQNLFDPGAPFGGWRLQESVPEGVLVVGIDNTEGRIDEYTHVKDVIGEKTLGGLGDAYADFLENTVRPLVRARYGEPGPVGVMGSSLGGLVSFHVADRHAGKYAFAASLSGTMGWGSIGSGVHEETMIERYAARGHRDLALYLDSGGGGKSCDDVDGDGIHDDQGDDDNYCENAQMRGVLLGVGYEEGKDLHYAYDPGAGHDEAAWASRVALPLEIFAGL